MAQARSVKREVLSSTRSYARGAGLAYALGMRFVLGFDGGGTKTECALMDEQGKVCTTARGGPSNPMRVGFGGAFAAVSEVGRLAMHNANLALSDVAAVCAGLAGAAQPESQQKMKKLLAEEFPSQLVHVCTDVDLKLEAAVEGRAIVLNVGTGTFAVARDRNGQMVRVGGHGPLLGDEGSAYDVGRRAVIAALREADRGKEDSPLAKRILTELRIGGWEELHLRVYSAPDDVFPRVFPIVASAADAGDAEAQALLEHAANELSELVADLVVRLDLQGQKLLLVKSGGMAGRSEFFDRFLDRKLKQVAPQAEFGELAISNAEAAARLALRMMLAADEGR